MSLTSNYRCYDLNEKVRKTYTRMYTQQTLSKVIALQAEYSNFNKAHLTLHEIINKLDSMIDESDPDIHSPQSAHALQTAEFIRTNYVNTDNTLQQIEIESLFTPGHWANLPKKYQILWRHKYLTDIYPHITDWSWFPLIGLIHDLGKVLALPEWNSLPQHFVVGDTFPVAIPLDPAVILYNEFSHIKKDYPDIQISTKGFDQYLFSFGHDNYLADVLKKESTLPAIALYIIRYHSFYPFHSPPANKNRGYTHIASEEDWSYLPILKAFQQADLYSKVDTSLSTNIPEFYDKLINIYVPGKLYW